MRGDSFVPDYPNADVRVSPNTGERRGKGPVDILLLHYTGMKDGPSAEDWLCDPQSDVSCHYIVHEDGSIVQMAPESRRAWHAGKSFWKGETDINSRSIGIEIVNGGHDFGMPDFPEAQIAAVIALARDVSRRNTIQQERVLAHSDVAPGRKLDPGEKFPWKVLAEAGVGHWVPPSPVSRGRFLALGDRGQPVEALQSMLALYGYGTDVTGDFDEKTATRVAAFQRHFRPSRVDGVADSSTIETLHGLLAALPRYAV
ncbi:N-acetylmuramoyl-L-alanine amidase [Oricola cellulosilytica]|uniref:N-acetylmuramoyl-L-alanine amidase n=1 Tax=Oricola cellulosilytica TaxID=1429082 RepID=A0A4R0PFU5_9HYPH|nr:N-acetylmuramoyl-L-alanine amidase [Oricola cellulosilytica]TCD14364.1 N-acetylmuramoyl-L-alanine amidase [Oricola cellulosilytica]